MFHNYGYLAIFLLLAPGTFGIPVPDELLLTFIGYLVLRGDLRLIPALAVVVAGAILGITLDYWVGRAVGAKLIRESGGFLRLRPDKFQGLKEWLRRRGGWVLFLGYFLPGVRHWVAIAAGITRFPLAGFTRFAYSGALAWSLLYIFLGYFLGPGSGPLSGADWRPWAHGHRGNRHPALGLFPYPGKMAAPEMAENFRKRLNGLLLEAIAHPSDGFDIVGRRP